jgi:hypothetical protein
LKTYNTRIILTLFVLTIIHSVFIYGCIKSCNIKDTDSSYEYKAYSYFKKLTDCQHKDSTMCPNITIVYDKFTKGPNIENLNKSLINYLINDVDYKTKEIKYHTEKYFDTLANNFFAELKSNNNNSPGIPSVTYVLKITNLYSKFFTITLSNNWYYGGGQAHPNGYNELITISFKTRNKILAAEIFVDKFEEKLDKKINQKLKKDLGLKETDRLSKNSYIEHDSIKFNGNFNFSNDSLVFVYNPYEIARYAAGSIEIRLSALDLKDIIKEDIFIILTNNNKLK